MPGARPPRRGWGLGLRGPPALPERARRAEAAGPTPRLSKAPGEGERTPEGRRRGPSRDKPPGPRDARGGEKPLPFHFLPGGAGTRSRVSGGAAAPPGGPAPPPAPGPPRASARACHRGPGRPPRGQRPAQEARSGGPGGRRLPPHCVLTVPSGLPRFRARQSAAVAPSERLDRPRRAMPAG